MESSVLFAFFSLLALADTVRCQCMGDSYVVISGEGSDANETCSAVNSSEVECIDPPELSLNNSWTRADCTNRNCTVDLLRFVSCQFVDNSSELAIQIDPDVRVILTHSYVFTKWASVVIEGLGEGATVHCLSKVGVVFQRIVSLVIRNITWENCGGSELDVLDEAELSGALLVLQISRMSVLNSAFVESVGAGVVIKTRVLQGSDNRTFSYGFANSTFRDSRNTSLSTSHDGGGGVAVNVFQYILESDGVEKETFVVVSFHECSFVRNEANTGGGVFVNAVNANGKSVPLRLDADFQACNFTNNSALVTGGAVTISGIELSQPSALFDDCHFFDNRALSAGGAVYLGIQAILPGNTHVGFTNCYWESNNAAESSALFISSIRPAQPIDTLNITNITMVTNEAQLVNYDAHCTVTLRGITQVTLNRVNISNNTGSGLCIHRSAIVINGSTWIAYNRQALSGGGICMYQESYLTLTKGSSLTLESNTAVYGGGIFVTQSSNGVCFLNTTEDCVDVLLANNQAFFNGAAMYFEAPSESCITELEKLCKPSYQSTDVNSPVTSNTDLIFNSGTTELFPGQQIQLEANMKDFFGNSGKAIVRVYLYPRNSQYYLMGSTQFTLHDGVNSPNLTIFGPEPTDSTTLFNLEIVALDLQSSLSGMSIIFPLHIISCPLGYYNTTQNCTCFKGVECDDFTGVACIHKGDWFGNFPDNSSHSVLLTCSSGFCSNIGNCDSCTIQGDYCALSDPQCIQSRVGPVCLECPEGFSYTFGAIRCADNKYCKIPGLVTAMLIIIYCILGFALLFVIMKFTMRTTLGTLFSFVYYFSVIDLVLPPSIVDNNILSVVYVIQSFTQLNPNFLGLVPVCVAKDASILVLEYLLYVSPVVVWAIVIIMVLCSRRCSKHVKFSDRTPIMVISLLILLTFTAFTKTSFDIILPVRFHDINETYINIAPSTQYFATIDHLIFFIVAIIVLIVGVLPFMSFLFLAPFLTHCFNLVRIKPLLDEFQACYKDEYRWMAGFYFLCRIPYFLFKLFRVVIIEEYVLQFLSLGVLLFHVMLQPYKVKTLNIADTILLADILCFSLLYGNTAETFFQNVGFKIRDGIAYVLIVLPVIIVFLLFLAGLYQQHPLLKKCLSESTNRDKETDSLSDSSVSVPYREPLLSVDRSFDPVRLTNYENGASIWKTGVTHEYTHGTATCRKSDGDKDCNCPNFTEIVLDVLNESNASEP